MPRCAHCRDKFKSKYFNQKYCLDKDPCIKAFSISVQKKKRKKEKEIMKEKLLTRSDYVKLLQTVFNKFIRLRDKGLPCISCGTTAKVDYAAGHFIPAGNYSYLRFNEFNVNLQCNTYCNCKRSGNVHEYRPNLIKKIGLEEVEKLEADRHKKLELSVTEIKDLIIVYKKRIN